MIKIRFATQNMAYHVLHNGIKILNQFLPPTSIEREVFIRLTPCYNCYKYDHTTRNCQAGQLTLCNKCSGNNHRSERCTSNHLKCLNCQQEHHTFANRCPTRKAKIPSGLIVPVSTVALFCWGAIMAHIRQNWCPWQLALSRS